MTYFVIYFFIALGLNISNGLLAFGEETQYKSTTILEESPSVVYQFCLREGLLNYKPLWNSKTAIRELNSSGVMEAVAEELDLVKDTDTQKKRREIIDNLQAGVEIKEIAPGFIEISAVYPDPYDCQTIVKRLSRWLVRDRILSIDNETEGLMEWISNELEFFKKKLRGEEEILDKFRKRNKAFMSDIKAGLHPVLADGIIAGGNISRRYEKYSQELLDSGIEYKTLNAEEKMLSEELKGTDKRIITKKETDSKTGNVILETEALNPVYQKLQIDLIQCRRRISGIEEKMKVVKEITVATEKKLEEIPEKVREYSVLLKRYNNQTEMYEKFENLKEKIFLMIRLGIECRGVYFRVLESAEVPREPYIPD